MVIIELRVTLSNILALWVSDFFTEKWASHYWLLIISLCHMMLKYRFRFIISWWRSRTYWSFINCLHFSNNYKKFYLWAL